MELNKQQKKHLKGLGHALKPVVMIGQNGLTEAVLQETKISLAAHELIKMKIGGEDKKERQSLVEAICEQTDSLHVNTIGKQAIFYRPSKKRLITLP